MSADLGAAIALLRARGDPARTHLVQAQIGLHQAGLITVITRANSLFLGSTFLLRGRQRLCDTHNCWKELVAGEVQDVALGRYFLIFVGRG